MDLEQFNSRAQAAKKKNQVFFARIKKQPPKDLDSLFHEAHEVVFNNTDCLGCANCCKTTSPIFYQKDIERAAKALKIKAGDFLKTFLFMDEDGDFVLHTTPCPFLNADNTCRIYDSRPDACREYPHTNRKKMAKILDLTYRNTLVCPAVLEIVERIKKADY